MNSASCLWCGGSLCEWQVLEDRYLGIYPEPVPYGRCKSCGSLGQLTPLLPGELGKAYPNGYWLEGADKTILARLALRYQRKIVAFDHGRFVKKLLGSLAGKRVLEIGPGRGDFLLWAKSQGAQVKGWERSSQAITFLRTSGLDAEEVILEDLENWPAQEEPWDLIAGFHVLEHLVNPMSVVAALISRLASGGFLIFQLPRADSWQAKLFQKNWFGLEAPRHVTVPTIDGLKQFASLLDLNLAGQKHFSLRDNANAMLLSLIPSLGPNRPPSGKGKLLGYVLGIWLLQPMAYLEGLMGKGGTIMMAFQPRSSTPALHRKEINTY